MAISLTSSRADVLAVLRDTASWLRARHHVRATMCIEGVLTQIELVELTRNDSPAQLEQFTARIAQRIHVEAQHTMRLLADTERRRRAPLEMNFWAGAWLLERAMSSSSAQDAPTEFDTERQTIVAVARRLLTAEEEARKSLQTVVTAVIELNNSDGGERAGSLVVDTVHQMQTSLATADELFDLVSTSMRQLVAAAAAASGGGDDAALGIYKVLAMFGRVYSIYVELANDLVGSMNLVAPAYQRLTAIANTPAAIVRHKEPVAAETPYGAAATKPTIKRTPRGAKTPASPSSSSSASSSFSRPRYLRAAQRDLLPTLLASE